MRISLILMHKNNALLFLWLTYFCSATLTLTIWTMNNWFSVTGDEPHYLVMADGIIEKVSVSTVRLALKKTVGAKFTCKPAV